MTVAACFISRAAGGLAITGARWFDLKGDSSWRGVPADKAVEDPARAAQMLVEWLAVQAEASPGRPEIILVLDADGAGCGWMTAESGEPEVVRAAVRDGLTESEEDTSASLAWMGAWVGPSEAGAATSVQALTDVTLAPDKTSPAAARRQRLGVMSVPDAPIRLVLDALDRAGFRVRRVCTVWHAMAAAQAAPAIGATGAPQVDGRRIVAEASSDDATAVIGSVIIEEPLGELLWAWSQGCSLLCAGSIKLRESVDETDNQPAPGLRLVDADGADDAGERREPAPSVVEVTRSDVGRLTTDWLGWSVQTGVAPERISVAGPGSITCSGLEFDLPDMLGVGAVAAGIGKAWPGTAVKAVATDDPIGSIIRRMVDTENHGDALPAGPMAVDPRQSVTTLSTRPGRASRTLHLWGGLALMAGAVAITVLGVRAGRSAQDLEAQLVAMRANRADILATARKLGAIVPADNPDPVAVIQGKVNEKLAQRRELRDEDPLVPELGRFLRASSGIEGLELRSLALNSSSLLATAEFLVRDDAGPTFLERIRATRSGATRELRWDGRTVGVDGTRRRFNLSGKMEDAPKTTTSPQGPKPSAKPADSAAPNPASPTPAPELPAAPVEPVPAPSPEPSGGSGTEAKP